jgi:hypothetical protein
LPASCDRIARRACVNMMCTTTSEQTGVPRALAHLQYRAEASSRRQRRAPPEARRAIVVFIDGFASSRSSRDHAARGGPGVSLDPETLAVLAGVLRASSDRQVPPATSVNGFTYQRDHADRPLCAADPELDARQLISPAMGTPEDFIRHMQSHARRALAPESSRPKK